MQNVDTLFYEIVLVITLKLLKSDKNEFTINSLKEFFGETFETNYYCLCSGVNYLGWNFTQEGDVVQCYFNKKDKELQRKIANDKATAKLSGIASASLYNPPRQENNSPEYIEKINEYNKEQQKACYQVLSGLMAGNVLNKSDKINQDFFTFLNENLKITISLKDKKETEQILATYINNFKTNEISVQLYNYDKHLNLFNKYWVETRNEGLSTNHLTVSSGNFYKFIEPIPNDKPYTAHKYIPIPDSLKASLSIPKDNLNQYRFLEFLLSIDNDLINIKSVDYKTKPTISKDNWTISFKLLKNLTDSANKNESKINPQKPEEQPIKEDAEEKTKNTHTVSKPEEEVQELKNINHKYTFQKNESVKSKNKISVFYKTQRGGTLASNKRQEVFEYLLSRHNENAIKPNDVIKKCNINGKIPFNTLKTYINEINTMLRDIHLKDKKHIFITFDKNGINTNIPL